jgi:Holliday junction resolvase-like predicted endonuclease
MVDNGPEQIPNKRNDAENIARENLLKADLEKAWDCTLHHLPQFYHVDFFAERDGELKAWVEVKQRNCTSTQYPTVFMNVDRKFKHLIAHAETAPAYFVVRWSDGVTRFIDVRDVRPEWLGEGQENNRWGEGQHDREAVFHVPIDEMRVI